MFVIFVLCVVALLACVGVFALSYPRRLVPGSDRSSNASSAESAEFRRNLGALAPPTNAVLDTLPKVVDGGVLRNAPAVPAPETDLSVIGCGEDKDSNDAAVWRSVRTVLSKRNSSSPLELELL